MLTLIVCMQHITLALISARREAMWTRVWSIGFVAPSPRNTFCFLFLSFSIVPDTYHMPINIFLSSSFLEGGSSTDQSCKHQDCTSISMCISNTFELESHSFYVFPCRAKWRAESISDESSIHLIMRDSNKQSSQTTSKRKKFAEESDEFSDSEPSTQQPITQSTSQSASNISRFLVVQSPGENSRCQRDSKHSCSQKRCSQTNKHLRLHPYCQRK